MYKGAANTETKEGNLDSRGRVGEGLSFLSSTPYSTVPSKRLHCLGDRQASDLVLL